MTTPEPHRIDWSATSTHILAAIDDLTRTYLGKPAAHATTNDLNATLALADATDTITTAYLHHILEPQAHAYTTGITYMLAALEAHANNPRH